MQFRSRTQAINSILVFHRILVVEFLSVSMFAKEAVEIRQHCWKFVSKNKSFWARAVHHRQPLVALKTHRNDPFPSIRNNSICLLNKTVLNVATKHLFLHIKHKRQIVMWIGLLLLAWNKYYFEYLWHLLELIFRHQLWKKIKINFFSSCFFHQWNK